MSFCLLLENRIAYFFSILWNNKQTALGLWCRGLHSFTSYACARYFTIYIWTSHGLICALHLGRYVCCCSKPTSSNCGVGVNSIFCTADSTFTTLKVAMQYYVFLLLPWQNAIGKMYDPEVCERMSKNLKHKMRQTFQSTEVPYIILWQLKNSSLATEHWFDRRCYVRLHGNYLTYNPNKFAQIVTQTTCRRQHWYWFVTHMDKDVFSYDYFCPITISPNVF